MRKKHRKVCMGLNYIEHLLFELWWLSDVFQILLLLFLVGIPIITAISAVRLKICSITVGIKKYKSIIKKKKKHDKIVLLAKTKLHSTEVLL